MTPQPPNQPEGHRQRLRERFRQAPDTLSDAELVELLLTYAIPRRDVGPLARDLLASHGGLRALLAAPRDSLVSLEGIGDSAATLVRLVGHLISSPPNEVPPMPVEDPQQRPLFDDPPTEESPAAPEPAEPEMRTFAQAEIAATLALLPQAERFASLDAFREHARSTMPYNSAGTRARRANYVLNRFFPKGTLRTPLAYYAARCSSPEDLQAAVFYELALAEPVVAMAAEEVIWPALAQGSVDREVVAEFIVQHLPDLRPASRVKIVRAVAETYRELGVAHGSGDTLQLRLRQGSLEAFIYVFFGEFPEPGVYRFERMEQGPMRRWLLWERDWLRRQLYNLRDMDLVSKVSEIDTLRQFTTTMTRHDALRRFFDREQGEHRFLRESH